MSSPAREQTFTPPVLAGENITPVRGVGSPDFRDRSSSSAREVLVCNNDRTRMKTAGETWTTKIFPAVNSWHPQESVHGSRFEESVWQLQMILELGVCRSVSLLSYWIYEKHKIRLYTLSLISYNLLYYKNTSYFATSHTISNLKFFLQFPNMFTLHCRKRTATHFM